TASRAVRKRTGVVCPAARNRRNRVSPSALGSHQSKSTTSHRPPRKACQPASPSAARSTVYPSSRRPRTTKSAMPSSSSTSSMRTPIGRTDLIGEFALPIGIGRGRTAARLLGQVVQHLFGREEAVVVAVHAQEFLDGPAAGPPFV